MINICARRAKTALMQCIDAQKKYLIYSFFVPYFVPV